MDGNSVWSLTETPSGELWFGTWRGGVGRVSTDGGFLGWLREEDATSPKLLDSPVVTLFADTLGHVWIGYYGAGVIDRVAVDTRQLSRFTLGATDTTVRAITGDADGGVLVGTDAGLLRWDVDAATFVAEPIGVSPDERPAVQSVLRDRNGSLWLTGSFGLRQQSSGGDSFRSVPLTAALRTGRSVRLWDLFEDRSGQLWVTTLGGGVLTLPTSWRNFSVVDPALTKGRRVNGTLVDSRGDLWLATATDGVIHIDANSQNVARPELTGATPALNGRVWALAEGSRGRLWMGAHDGLYLRSADGLRFNRVAEAPGFIDHALADAKGGLWLSLSGYGLGRFEPDRGRLIRYPGGGQRGQGPSGREIKQMQYGRDQSALLIASELGLDQMDVDDGSFTALLEEAEPVHAFAQGANGLVWIAFSDGLARYRWNEGRLDPERRPVDGLPPIPFFGSALDEAGRLWLTSSRGLFRWDPESQRARHFTWRDGLPGNEFRRRPLTKSSDGRMFAMTATDLVTFMPSLVVPDDTIPPVAITSVRTPAGERLQRPATGFAGQADLEHADAIVSFSYIALHSPGGEAITYRHRLEGLETQWVNAGNRRERSYNNLAPGDYRFRVQASVAGSDFALAEAAFGLSVSPPIWRSGWMYGAYVVVATLAAFAAVRAYRNRLGRQHLLDRARDRQSWAETQRDMTRSLTSTLDGRQILGRLLEGLTQVVPADRTIVRLLDPALPPYSVESGDPTRADPSPEAMRDILHELRRDSPAEPATLSAMGAIGQTLLVPIQAREHGLGLVYMRRHRGQSFVERERLMAGTYAPPSGHRFGECAAVQRSESPGGARQPSQPGQVGLLGEDESRNPHAHERDSGYDGVATGLDVKRRTAGLRAGCGRLRSRALGNHQRHPGSFED